MIGLEAFLVALAEEIPIVAGDAMRGVEVSVTSLDVDLPVEIRVDSRARILASPPRGMWRAGFEIPLGAVKARFHVTEP
jgi:hypothetical protein